MGVVTTHGSSTINGVGDRKGGLAGRCRSQFNEAYEMGAESRHGVYDYSETAERITETSYKFQFQAEHNIKLKNTKWFAVMNLGMYDSSFREDRGRYQIALEQFQQFVIAICQTGYDLRQQRGGDFDMLFLGMPPLAGSEVRLGNDIFRERPRLGYDDAVRHAATQYGFPFESLYNLCGGYTGHKEGFVSRDGVHASTKGNDVIESVVMRYAQPFLDQVAIPAAMATGATVLQAPEIPLDQTAGGVVLPTSVR